MFQSTSSAGSFQFTDPTIRITTDNSFGFNAGLTFSQFYSADLNGNTLDIIQYNSQIPPYTFPTINQPSVEGNTQTTDIVLNSTNSNIVTIFNSTPKYLIFNSSGVSVVKSNV